MNRFSGWLPSPALLARAAKGHTWVYPWWRAKVSHSAVIILAISPSHAFYWLSKINILPRSQVEGLALTAGICCGWLSLALDNGLV